MKTDGIDYLKFLIWLDETCEINPFLDYNKTMEEYTKYLKNKKIERVDRLSDNDIDFICGLDIIKY
jgi:hypothetical protein